MNRTLMIIGAALLCAIVGTTAVPQLTGTSTSAASDAVASLSWVFFGVRVAFGLSVWCFWNPIIVWLMTDKEGQRASEEAINVYQSQRNRFAALLVIIEIVFVQNVFARLLGWLL